MPQIVPLTLHDSDGNPHTFNPSGITPAGVTSWKESTGVPLADRVVTMSTSRTAAGRRKSTIKLVVPVVQTQTVAGVSTPALVRTAYAEISVSFDPSSTVAERATFLQHINSTLAPTGLGNPVVRDLESFW
jgi:hypothetical protein